MNLVRQPVGRLLREAGLNHFGHIESEAFSRNSLIFAYFAIFAVDTVLKLE
jgi:hypothetical protein